MIVVPFEAAHMHRLSLQKAQEGNLAWMSPEHPEVLESLNSYTVLDGDEVVMCAGIFKVWEGRGTAWAFLSSGIGKRFIKVHRLVKQYFDFTDFDRLEAEVHFAFPEGHRWLKLLGFTCEVECAKRYFPDGSDASLYSKVKP